MSMSCCSHERPHPERPKCIKCNNSIRMCEFPNERSLARWYSTGKCAYCQTRIKWSKGMLFIAAKKPNLAPLFMVSYWPMFFAIHLNVKGLSLHLKRTRDELFSERHNYQKVWRFAGLSFISRKTKGPL